MIAQDHGRARAQIGHQTFLLTHGQGDAFIVVIAQATMKAHGVLRQRQQPFLQTRQRHARLGMQVHDALRILARSVDGSVDHEAGRIRSGDRWADHIALQIDLHQTGRGDFVKGQPQRVDQEMMLLARHPGRQVGVDQIVPAEQRAQAIGRRQIAPHLHLGGAGRGGILHLSHRQVE